MNVLLDTHAWIWSQEAPEEFGTASMAILSDTTTHLFVSTISTLELARLAAAGTIAVQGRLRDWIRRSLDALHCDTVNLSHEIAEGAYALPGEFHRDPADRVLVATARLRNFTLLTADERILGYRHVRTHNARS